MRKKLLLILNPNAGMQKANKYLVNILNLFSQASYDAKVCLTQRNFSASEIVTLYGKDSDLIVCIGGDGTLNQTVSGVVSSGYKGLVGYIPTGRVNDFASTLKLNKDIIYATSDILFNFTLAQKFKSFSENQFYIDTGLKIIY